MHTFSAFLRGNGKVLLDNTYGLGALSNKGFQKYKNRKNTRLECICNLNLARLQNTRKL